MTNATDFAFIPEFQTGADGMKHHPLTKREYFAAMAMQGILSHGWNIHEYNEASKYSVQAADALITALNQKP
jgi:hypothetical protein